ncbi:hypothetical protein [Planomonospora venezuelensis]|uniref:Lipoprotein n=1 Tax=Planomonospora venezuelensis TaxID=1999 RepID=A0A841D4X3_PLAVE|nr:hypothetical protein [Planomonospora venezuelensis]MBB5964013.1 hypothetical protein [Planomonospora venezuelensis]GIN05051.1 hypothetical protein Pve01_67090 [Planomonospora venezuelensis]
MKRLIAGLTCAVSATAVLAAPASASAAHVQAPDPLAALKGQLATGRGVAFSDVTKTTSGGKSRVFSRLKGSLGFSRSGIASADMTGRLHVPEKDKEVLPGLGKLDRPERVIWVKNISYVSGGLFGEVLPEGKKWLRTPGMAFGIVGVSSHSVNAAEPATLKALLARATVKHPSAYSGKITFSELYKVSPWFRASFGGKPTAKEAKTVITWKLALGAGRLPARLTAAYRGTEGTTKGSTVTMDTRYTGWGSKVTVKAPPADQVARPDELENGGE